MACNEIHVNDVGTVFQITVKDCSGIVDISLATVKQVIFKKPDGTKLIKTASFATDGTDGVINYTTIAGDLSAAGKWKLQAIIILPSGTNNSDVVEFTVYANL